MESQETHSRSLMSRAGVAIGTGMLFKGLLTAVLPLGAIVAYLIVSGEWRTRHAWQRIAPGWMVTAAILIAAPWHVLAILQNPPYLAFTLESSPGQYHGFFWRYFVNEHLLRYLGWRYPPDYNRVPLLWFWLGLLIWLFPWSGLLAFVGRQSIQTTDRAGRTRLLMFCCCGFILLFFSASTTQEYYTLPAYAAVILLMASAAVASPGNLQVACRMAVTCLGLVTLLAVFVLANVWNLPAEADIAATLGRNPEAYTLSLGHFQDLTLESFAYLRGPLLLASVGFAMGTVGGWLLTGRRAATVLVCTMVLILYAAHWAMAVFDPYLSSRSLAKEYQDAPPGQLILNHEYYEFSSLVFYTNHSVLLLNGRKNNLEYGSNAPNVPDVFINDNQLSTLWKQYQPVYLATQEADQERFRKLLGSAHVFMVARHGGKLLLSNHSHADPH